MTTGHLTLVVQTGATICKHERCSQSYRHESTTVGDSHYIDETCLDCGMRGPFPSVTFVSCPAPQ